MYAISGRASVIVVVPVCATVSASRSIPAHADDSRRTSGRMGHRVTLIFVMGMVSAV